MDLGKEERFRGITNGKVKSSSSLYRETGVTIDVLKDKLRHWDHGRLMVWTSWHIVTACSQINRGPRMVQAPSLV